jgi:hypothetical protein
VTKAKFLALLAEHAAWTSGPGFIPEVLTRNQHKVQAIEQSLTEPDSARNDVEELIACC